MTAATTTLASKLTCLFWNVGGNDRSDLICQLMDERSIDIAVIVEPCGDENELLPQLQGRLAETFQCPVAETRRIHIFVRDASLGLREVYGTISGRMTIRLLNWQDTDFLFVAMHLPSKINFTTEDQTAEVMAICQELRAEERRRGHRRTILAGDLNMNPFEPGIIQTSGLHAAMTRRTAMAGDRVVQGQSYPYFYNPMWGCFGDRTPGPAGTHYFRGKHLSYDWNMYDQVLVRPDVLPWFDDKLEIITRIGETSLLTREGRPNPNVGSDHLPLVFGLLENEETC